MLLAMLSLVTALVLNGVALAHDDPIVTVRILCNGFNVLDMDAVLGEISDSATLSVDRPVHGGTEIQAPGLTHAYASTANGVQGRTSTTAYVLFSEAGLYRQADAQKDPTLK